MKNLSKYTAFLLFVLLISLNAVAQQGQGRGRYTMDPKDFAERQTTQIKESLNLTAEQLPKVEALNLKYAEKMSEARTQTEGDREAMRGKMREMMTEKDTELKEILTADQWTKFEADRKERMQNRGGGGGRRGI